MIEYKPAALKSVKLLPLMLSGQMLATDNVRQTLRDTVQLPTLLPLFSRLTLNFLRECAFWSTRVWKNFVGGAVANECGLNFIGGKGPEILNKYIGGGEENVRNLFACNGRSLDAIFDEFDSIAP